MAWARLSQSSITAVPRSVPRAGVRRWLTQAWVRSTGQRWPTGIGAGRLRLAIWLRSPRAPVRPRPWGSRHHDRGARWAARTASRPPACPGSRSVALRRGGWPAPPTVPSGMPLASVIDRASARALATTGGPGDAAGPGHPAPGRSWCCSPARSVPTPGTRPQPATRCGECAAWTPHRNGFRWDPRGWGKLDQLPARAGGPAVGLGRSSAHLGLKRAIAVILPAGWQRDRVHLLRNLLTRVPTTKPALWGPPRSAQTVVATLVRSIFDQASAEAVQIHTSAWWNSLRSASERRPDSSTRPSPTCSPSPPSPTSTGGRSGPAAPRNG